MGEHGKEEAQSRTSYKSLVDKEWRLDSSMILDRKKGTNPKHSKGKINLTPCCGD